MLTNTNLQRAILDKANLQDADLQWETNLQGASLSGAP